ncbi:uncharacterized protein UMAG_01053 [Mycosarcoma maydis]|uniref:Uncharacterized protein n=1 Tax=Mycosarcoma maydis TaxID=5270 RepID=A0A0D1CXR4_MYCMD|nr:uncharacterized protein UMAG_01053 [Ustilago maydis 521]KIS71143.1 hypothetical protein UMAG_01053 [Ustilago maydis 521]|eukprot:XP_011387021.1 hypothetical protein UMAG_01053 [Ustilago maydis 521]
MSLVTRDSSQNAASTQMWHDNPPRQESAKSPKNGMLCGPSSVSLARDAFLDRQQQQQQQQQQPKSDSPKSHE